MNKYENDLTHIRQMMERSSTFISLSGLSGVGAGLVALASCALTFYILAQYQIDYFDGKPNYYSYEVIIQLAIVAITTLVLAIASGIYFTVKKSKKLRHPLWSAATRNTIKAAAIPLVIGGLFCIIITWHHLFYLVAPCMLIFYGLALVSASKYTQSDIFWLGIFQLTLGILASVFVGYGLVFWGIGFGILHIIYGVWMYQKYK
ncbi:MAG: hypothetical protein IPK35_13260 [Saprospiraceae bacterium]|jgi:hypothetical protein|nr:hypothetical protein [Saprospiraceae bacterium]